MLSNIFSSDNKQKEIHTSVLKVRGKTLIFDRTIYYIPNLSAVEIGQLARSFPLLALLIGLAGIILVTSRGSELYGLVALGISGFWIYSVYNSKKHGLHLITNSGASTIIVSNDLEFLKQVAQVLYNIMNDEDMNENYNFNFDQRKIVEVGSLEGSAIVFDDSNAPININRSS